MTAPIAAGATEYGAVAKILHWLIFALLAAQYGIAWTMPDIDSHTEDTGLVALHLSVGTAILALVLVRFAWRIGHPVEPLREGIPPVMVLAGRAMHWLLYALLLVLPFLGWAAASAHGWPISLLGLPLPELLPTGARIGFRLGDVHALLANVLLYLVGLHVVAALYHHFFRRDRVLVRMLRRGG